MGYLSTGLTAFGPSSPGSECNICYDTLADAQSAIDAGDLDDGDTFCVGEEGRPYIFVDGHIETVGPAYVQVMDMRQFDIDSPAAAWVIADPFSDDCFVQQARSNAGSNIKTLHKVGPGKMPEFWHYERVGGTSNVRPNPDGSANVAVRPDGTVAYHFYSRSGSTTATLAAIDMSDGSEVGEITSGLGRASGSVLFVESSGEILVVSDQFTLIDATTLTISSDTETDGVPGGLYNQGAILLEDESRVVVAQRGSGVDEIAAYDLADLTTAVWTIDPGTDFTTPATVSGAVISICKIDENTFAFCAGDSTNNPYLYVIGSDGSVIREVDVSVHSVMGLSSPQLTTIAARPESEVIYCLVTTHSTAGEQDLLAVDRNGEKIWGYAEENSGVDFNQGEIMYSNQGFIQEGENFSEFRSLAVSGSGRFIFAGNMEGFTRVIDTKWLFDPYDRSEDSGVISFYRDGTYTVPPGVTELEVRCWGAGGGAGRTAPGGGGAYVQGRFPVGEGDVLTCTVGTGGRAGENGTGEGGVPGGGNGTLEGNEPGGGGGGYSCAELHGTLMILAGGGGGAGGRDGGTDGGAAAFSTAQDGLGTASDSTAGGAGATAGAGGAGGTASSGFDGNAGASLQGGDAYQGPAGDGAGGGGGGYYGGGGGAVDSGGDGGGGGGGSSYVAGSVTDVVSYDGDRIYSGIGANFAVDAFKPIWVGRGGWEGGDASEGWRGLITIAPNPEGS